MDVCLPVYLSLLADTCMACTKNDWYLWLFLPPLIKLQLWVKKSSPEAWGCHHHASSWTWYTFDDALFWWHANLLNLWNSYTFLELFPSDRDTFCHMVCCDLVALGCFFVRKDPCIATTPHNSDLWSIQEIFLTSSRVTSDFQMFLKLI